MRASLTIVGNDILCRRDSGRRGEDVRIALTSETLARLRTWARQYDRAVRSGDASLLLGLGAEIWTWLDGSGWASGWATGAGDRLLELAVDDPGSAAARALLDVPWETLVRAGDFLAADPNQTFVAYRSIGRPADAVPLEAAYRDLAAMFMAAAPEGQQELAFEAEEAAILDATARLPMQLVVEESGCSDFLKERPAQEGPFEVVHLSCHGDIRPDRGPVLALETPEGDLTFGPREISPVPWANRRRRWSSCPHAARPSRSMTGMTRKSQRRLSPLSVRWCGQGWQTCSDGTSRPMTSTRRCLHGYFTGSWQRLLRSPMSRQPPAATC